MGLRVLFAALVVAGACLGPSTALASGVWSAPTDIGDSSLFPNSVSCSSATFCAAVAGTFSSFTGYGYALTYNGTSWTAPTNIGSSGGDLRSVSCPSATFCVAVGSGGAVGGAVTYNGTSWTASINLGGGAYLQSVSCASATFCAAVGGNGQSGYALTYNGTSWSAPTNIGSGGLSLDSVSCPSATFCVAVGNNGSYGGYAVTYNGTSWSAPTHSGPDNNGNSRVSCSSAKFCAAAFYAFSGSYVQTYNGTSWAAPTKVGGREVLPLSSVSCPSATFCVVVGNNGSGGGYALTYNGTSWAGRTVDTGYTGEFRGLNSVSCPSTSFCEAVSSGTAVTYRTATAGGAKKREEEATKKKHEEEALNGSVVCGYPASLPKGYVITEVFYTINCGAAYEYNVPGEYLGHAAVGRVNAVRISVPSSGLVVCGYPASFPARYVVTEDLDTNNCGPAYEYNVPGEYLGHAAVGRINAVRISVPSNGLVVCGYPEYVSIPAGYVATEDLYRNNCGGGYIDYGYNAVRIEPQPKNPTLTTKSLIASANGTLDAYVTCPRSAKKCTGSVVLQTSTAVSARASAHEAKNNKGALLTLAAGSFKIPGGHAAAVKLQLSSKARKLLARVHLVRARATLTVHDPATHTTHATVTIRAAKSIPGHKA
jgi:hypothetical protein